MQDPKVDPARDRREPRPEGLPAPQVDLDWVREKVKSFGLTVTEGPFINHGYFAARGVVMVRVKAHLGKGTSTSVRFLVDGDELRHVSTSERKKSSAEYRRARRQK